MDKRYRVAWKTELNGGYGQWTTKEIAKAWVEYANREFTGVTHWVEEESDGPGVD